uniref:Uncharacterized protein n=1 Tax=Acrobeloides nanus TaxID=290746 RepID=A0A914ENU1_9BILA
MSSKAPKQTFEPKWVQPKLGQNKQPNDFSQRFYVWSPSTSYTIASNYSSPSTSTIASNYSSPSTSTIASNYSSPSTSSSYADQINSLCVELVLKLNLVLNPSKLNLVLNPINLVLLDPSKTFTIKVTHLFRDIEVSQLEQELFGIFGDADSLGSQDQSSEKKVAFFVDIRKVHEK